MSFSQGRTRRGTPVPRGDLAVEQLPAAKPSRPRPASPPALAASTSTKWKSAQDLPDVASGEMLDYVLLAAAAPVALIDALQLATPGELSALLRAGPLFADTDPQYPGDRAHHFGQRRNRPARSRSGREQDVPAVPRAASPGGTSARASPPTPLCPGNIGTGNPGGRCPGATWSTRPPISSNPGAVLFTVPADIAPTEVAGRAEHWLRVRLAGGDYGEAKVTVVGQPGTTPGHHRADRRSRCRHGARALHHQPEARLLRDRSRSGPKSC